MKKKEINVSKLGLIIEGVDPAGFNDLNSQSLPPEETEDEDAVEMAAAESSNEFEDADYAVQNEIIKFFINNQAPTPEIVRQFSLSIGIDPEEFGYQQNILLTQLVNIYAGDADKLGYGSPWNSDEVDAEMIGADDEDIIKLLSAQSD